MRSFLIATKSILAVPMISARSKFSAIRFLANLTVSRKKASRSDVALAWRLKQSFFGYEDNLPFTDKKFELLRTIIKVAARSKDYAGGEPPTYRQLLPVYLHRTYPSAEKRWNALQSLNGFQEAIYASGPGTRYVPDAAWHIFDLLQVFARTPRVPFAAYEDLVNESFVLAKRTLEMDNCTTGDVPGFDIFLTKVIKRERDLIPEYPQLQDFHLGGH